MSPYRHSRGLVLSFAAFAACNGDRGAQQPLPPPELQPLIGELHATAKAMPQPDDAAKKELHDLGDVALQLVEADARTASRAERALLEHEHAWSVLEPALAHESIAVRRRAAWLCGRSGQTVLQIPLLLRLKYELDPETVVWVGDALQRLGNDTGLAWLDAAIGNNATADQAGQLAIDALRTRGMQLSDAPTWEEIRKLLAAVDATWRLTGAPTRKDLQPPEPKQLAARLAAHLAASQGTQLRPVDDARFVLTRAGTLPLPLLQRALTAKEPYLRTMALQVISELGAAACSLEATVTPLLGDPLTAAYAVRALGEIVPDARAADTAAKLRPMLGSIDTELRAAATQALGLLRDQASAPALRERLRDANETMDVRVGAAFGLRCLGADAEADAFLAERDAKKDYHEPTLARLRERLAAMRQ